ncbi:MAG TPA: DUF5020 family protein [Phnomibacter sp.]|nr:DUF5020 family protein [Phnomibacter sp.]
MKKVSLLLLVSFCAVSSFAQNIQLHYDCGKDRGYLTSTVELFKPDKLGSTFFFIDMDYGSHDLKGVTLAYGEIARSFKVFKKLPNLQPRIEYNGGFTRLSKDLSIPIENAVLAGMQYTWNDESFSKVFTLQANYKYIQDKHNAAFQLTGVWGLHFFDRKLSLTGFADFWREVNTVWDDNGAAHKTKYVFLAEPQVWYNFMPHFSVGSEVEMSSNFAGNKGFMANPTIAVKWTL